MKIVAGSDWRDALAFDEPVVAADVSPGEPTRCFTCGPDSEPLPRTALWAVKHRHPKNHSGYVRFYCSRHAPRVARHDLVTRSERPTARAARPPAPRRAAPVERERAICPDCFVEVPPTGVCGMCGQRVG